MVRLRMKALGRKHRPFFRICAMDSRTGRDSCPIEELGHYDPLCKDADTQTVRLQADRTVRIGKWAKLHRQQRYGRPRLQFVKHPSINFLGRFKE